VITVHFGKSDLQIKTGIRAQICATQLNL